jgi:hypothetical protein
MSLLLCGIVVSFAAASSFAQQRPPGWNWRPDQPATLQAWQETEARSNRDFTPPAPRGDLRGDIASNVRARPEPPRDDDARRRPKPARP